MIKKEQFCYLAFMKKYKLKKSLRGGKAC